MMELREKVLVKIREASLGLPVQPPAAKLADAILAIPEIAEALEANTPEARLEEYRSHVIDSERQG